MNRIAASARHDLSDAQWAVIRRSLWTLLQVNDVSPGPGRPWKYSRRQLIDGIRWRIRVGAPWRDVPSEYGSWQRVYGVFRQWQRAGIWARLLITLQAWADAAGLIVWEISVDSTIVRAHQHAGGARRDPQAQIEPPGRPDRPEPSDHALGRSRGGWTTKLHLAGEQGLKILSIVLTAGQRGDSPQFEPVLEAIGVPRLGAGRPRCRPVEVRADKAYSSRANRAYLRKRGIRACIPVKVDQQANRKAKGRHGGRPFAFDPESYKKRNAIERAINQLKQHRALATRYEKLALRYEAVVQVAAINVWLRALQNKP
ncbi:IS5 family transposase [Kineosporia sp. J2-2]|uniref:IS5 family transposase n=1 Tax=Kineosporia corallincola TaxID=2835133 RepID=A0ABS5TU48_9ACTN|nr:IS5 family transposase [Kineosporia corallincola]MBT0774328.1 IS5 family transposase [Kineosporia corallincola]